MDRSDLNGSTLVRCNVMSTFWKPTSRIRMDFIVTESFGLLRMWWASAIFYGVSTMICGSG